jgi:AcrR family transcriptional regulator
VAITLAASAIADAEGLEAVSIRRVAAELGAPPMSLYRHIANKEDLFTLMADKVKEEVLLQQPLPEDWREAMATLARRYYTTFVAHPWAVLLFTRRATFGSASTKLAKQMARALAGLRLESDDVWLVGGTVNDYVIGHSLRAVSAPTAAELADAVAPSDVVEFPDLASLKDSLRSRSSSDRFERGLEMVLDGIERRFVDGAARN